MDIFKNGTKRIFVCLLCLLLTLWQLTSVEAEDSKPVRVGWYEGAYNITDANGLRRGYNYEYQQSIAAYTGWHYIYVKGEWDDLLQKLENGDIDLLGPASYTEERSEKMLFSNAPMGHERCYLYVNLRDTGISPSHLETLNGKRIILIKNSVSSDQFLHWAERNKLHLEPVYVRTMEEGKEKLRRGYAQCIVSAQTPLWDDIGLSAITMVGSSDIFYAINPKRPDLKEELDQAMSRLAADNMFYSDTLYLKYMDSVTKPALDADEIDWLKKHGPIRIGWLANDHGFSSENPATGRPIGLINDYMAYAKQHIGKGSLSFTPVKFETPMEEIEALKNGKIDMIFHYAQAPYWAEKNHFSLSQTVLSTSMVALTWNSDFDETNPCRVAASRTDFWTKDYITYQYPNWEIKEYDSDKAAYDAVRNKEADCYIIDATRAMEQLSRSRDSRLHSVLLNQSAQMTFAVQHSNKPLLSILNKTLKALPPTLLTNSLSTYTHTLTKSSLIDFIRANIITIAVSASTVVLAILLIIYHLLRRSKQAEAESKAAVKCSMKLNQQLQTLNRQLRDSYTALEKALKKADSANRAKTNFLFSMSHDIRTPMNAILGYGELIKQGLTDPKLLDYEKKMEQAGRLLLEIINNVLDMSRIESGKMELHEIYLDVSHMQEELYGIFSEEARKKNIHLQIDMEVDHPHILTDKTKIAEIFTNLISNAIKYTLPGGSVRMHAREIPCDQEGYMRIRTEIIDTGIGMSPEYLPHMFEFFSRERNTTVSKIAGTGLGLPIVKKLVDLMGGTLEVKSQQGKGTTFTITLTYRIADKSYYEKTEAEAASEKAVDKLKGKHILMAEDNDLNAEIATVLLEQTGLSIHRVDDGLQCVKELENQPVGTYDLILMDVQMPNMNGYQATQAIRALSDPKKAQIPIVAMTANAFEEDKQMAFQQGMNGHIAKPIDLEKAKRTLVALLN